MKTLESRRPTRRQLLKGMAAAGLLGAAPAICAKVPRGRMAVVIGAGIAGLSAAYDLRKAGFDVSIFEKRSWAGGRMVEAWMGPLYGLTHAAGVATFNREQFALARELGIEDQLMGQGGPGWAESEYGRYDLDAFWRPEMIARIPGVTDETRRMLPSVDADMERIRQEVDPCLLGTGAAYDDETIGDYFERKMGKEAGTQVVRYWIDPFLEWAGWPPYLTSKLGFLAWQAQRDSDFVIPSGGIGVLTRKLASLLPIQQSTTVRFITPPDADGRHTIHYLTPDMQARTVKPDVVVVATEGKFITPLVQGLTPAQQSFFRAIDFTKEAIVWYVLRPEAAPEKRLGGGVYIPTHPDRFKRRVNSWSVNPAEPDNHNRPPTVRVALSRPETPHWQWSNQPLEQYCEPLIKHFWPAFDMRNVVDIVNYTCDDVLQLPVGYMKQAAAILREQEKARRGLYFAGEYLSGTHTGAACASGRSVARTIARHWS
jgi:oxygen-dependent protoporphyrinogen oxidase